MGLGCRTTIITASVSAVLALAGFAHAQTALTTEQWRADLKFLAQELPRKHKNLFHRLTRAEWERQVRALDEAIPHLREMQIRGGLWKLIASARNGHTAIQAFAGTPGFPIALAAFADGYYVTGADPAYARAVGARVAGINGTPIEEIRRRLMPYVALENDVAPLVWMPEFMRAPAVLRAEDVLPDMDRATYELELDGSRFSMEVTSARPIEDANFVRVAEPRMYAEFRKRRLDYWFEVVPEAKAMYVQYNACREMAQQTFQAFSDEVMRAADAAGVEKFIVDMRFNGGGNSQVIHPMLDALKKRKQLRVFVLAGRFTYSSAFMNTLDLKKAVKATVVGEPLGQRPNEYGEVREFKLPNSGFTVAYATKFFRYFKDDRPALEPDVFVELRPEDLFHGRDAQLDYVLSR